MVSGEIKFYKNRRAGVGQQSSWRLNHVVVAVLVGVPTYRISQMVQNGGKILDAYGLVNVVSPSGLPMRGIIGITPDPIMLLAVNCKNVQESQAFYEQLGFAEQVGVFG